MKRHGPSLSLAELASGIFLLSFGVLLIEISFTRVFSYTISYHFAYLTIATALLGFGSAGSVLARFPGMLGDARRRLSVCTAVAGVAAAAALAFSTGARLDPAKVSSDPATIAVLASYYLVVAVPFFFAGICIATILSLRPDRVGTLYGADLMGAALGCAASVPLIWALETPGAVALGAFAIAASGYAFARNGRRPVAATLAGCAGVAVLGAYGITAPFPSSPGKFLYEFLRSPGAQHLFHQWTPITRVDAVGWERSENSWKAAYAVSGVGKRFAGRGPEFRMIGYDGGSFAVMYEYDGKPESLEVFRHHLMAVPYRILERPRTLIIGLGGGADALAGLANGAGQMTAVELNPVTVRLGRDDFRAFNGDLFNSPQLEVVTGEARHWVESRDERYDLVVLNSIDTLSALSSGAYVLAESYLYTVEAFQSYLGRLAPGGLYALFSFDNFGLAGPSFMIVRFAATLQQALANHGIAEAKSHVVVLAGEGSTPFVATLVKREPFGAGEIAKLDEFAAAEGFRFWHRPDRPVDHPVAEFLRMTPAEQEAFKRAHYLRFDPATDLSPFFFNFYKWASVVRRSPDDTGTTPATGQKMLLVMLVQAAVISLAMIVWPLGTLHAGTAPPVVAGALGYFSALGLGFILLEISLLQRFVLFLGYPTYSLSVVLFSMLLWTGAGSFVSSRLPAHARGAVLAAVVLAFLVAAFELTAPALFRGLLHAPLIVRAGVTAAVLAPIGLVLGLFFPLGIRIVEAHDPRLVPWAWAVNGCMTVIGTILAVMIAMGFGFRVVALGAVVVYAIGAAALATGVGSQGMTKRSPR